MNSRSRAMDLFETSGDAICRISCSVPLTQSAGTGSGAFSVRSLEVDSDSDRSLREWEHLRRGPWALRRIRHAHPLGLAVGHRIWQVVLTTDVFCNTKRGAAEWFHDPVSLVEQ